MKVAVVVFTIGTRHVLSFNNIFRSNLEKYCSKHGYDLKVRTTLIKEEPDMNRKKFFWQRLLVANEYRDYDFVISLDSDIYVNPNAPELPLKDIPDGKIGAVNERKYMGNYDWREIIQKKNKWEITGIDWYALSGEKKNYNDHINGGLVIYQPKYHANLFSKLYDDNIANYMKYNQDDQSFLSSYLIDNNMIWWLDERFNKVWFFWKELFYPIWNKLASEERKAVIANFIKLNYLCHFTSLHDVEYITNF